MTLVYEEEINDEYVTLLKIYNNDVYLYYYDTMEVTMNDYFLFEFEIPIIDFGISQDNMYVLSKQGIHYLNLQVMKTEDSLILRNKNITNLLVLDSKNICFSVGHNLFFAQFQFRKIKIKKPLISQSKNLLLITQKIDFDNNINCIVWSSFLNKILISQDHHVINQKHKILFDVDLEHTKAIMINNYYVYAVGSVIRLIRKDKYEWSQEVELRVNEEYVIQQLTSQKDYLFVLASNYRNMNCRIYKIKIKNIYII